MEKSYKMQQTIHTKVNQSSYYRQLCVHPLNVCITLVDLGNHFFHKQDCVVQHALSFAFVTFFTTKKGKSTKKPPKNHQIQWYFGQFSSTFPSCKMKSEPSVVVNKSQQCRSTPLITGTIHILRKFFDQVRGWVHKVTFRKVIRILKKRAERCHAAARCREHLNFCAFLELLGKSKQKFKRC